MKIKILSIVAAFTLLGISQVSASTVYAIHDGITVDTFDYVAVDKVDGTIMTDGKVGALGSADIIGWDLSVSSIFNGMKSTFTLTDSNSFLYYF